MQIEDIKIGDIIPYDKNPRKNDMSVDKVAASIKEFGFKVPIVIDKDNVVVCGHTRLKAAKKLKLESVPCVRADDLTEEQIKAYRLADNKVGEESEWDFDLLGEELGDIFDIDMGDFGFDLSVPETEEAHEDEYDFKETVEHRAKEGDIYKLGNHRLMCGDSSSGGDMEALLDGVKAKMVFTDPPYGVAIGDKNKTLNKALKAGRQTENIIGDTLSTEELYELLKVVFINIREHAEDDCSYYVTSPQGGEIGLMMMMMKDAGLEVRHNLIWEKNTATFSMRRLDYDYQHEPIFYTWTQKHNYYGKGKYKTTVWKFDKPRKSDLHPTMKPIELVAEALLNSSLKGEPVLDAFGGSGTTLMSCEQLERKCYMMEKDPKFVDVIIDRWESYTGGKAVLLNGETEERNRSD